MSVDEKRRATFSASLGHAGGGVIVVHQHDTEPEMEREPQLTPKEPAPTGEGTERRHGVIQVQRDVACTSHALDGRHLTCSPQSWTSHMTTLTSGGEITRLHYDPWRQRWLPVGPQNCTLVGVNLCVCCTIQGRRRRLKLATAIAHAFLSYPSMGARLHVAGTLQRSNLHLKAPRRTMRRSLSFVHAPDRHGALRRPADKIGWAMLRYAEYDPSGELCRLFLPCVSETALPYDIHPSGVMRHRQAVDQRRAVDGGSPEEGGCGCHVLGSVDATGRRRHHHPGLGWIYLDRALVFTFRGIPLTDVRVTERHAITRCRWTGRQALASLAVTPSAPSHCVHASALSRLVDAVDDEGGADRRSDMGWWSRVYAMVSVTPFSMIHSRVWKRVLGGRAMRAAQEMHLRALREEHPPPETSFSPGGPLASMAPLFRARACDDGPDESGRGGIGHGREEESDARLYGSMRVARLYLCRLRMKSQLPRCACGECLAFRSVFALSEH